MSAPAAQPDRLRRILYVIGSLDLGGTEKHLAQIAPRLKAMGWQPSIYCLSNRGVQAARLESEGISVMGPETKPQGRPFALRFLTLGASCFKLLGIMLRERPFTAHFFLPLSYLIGAPLAIVSRVPIKVMSRRSLNLYQRPYRFAASMERFLHHRMTRVLGNSRAVIRDLESESVRPDQTRLIYNGVDVAMYGEKKNYSGGQRFVFIIVANLIPYKGHADLLEALGRIAPSLPNDWELWCVGRNDGNQAMLEKLAATCSIAGNVKFLGARSDIPALLESADVGVLCSHEEGFSNSVLEGMAAGLTMVVTNVGGNPEAVVDGASGLTVPAKNPAALGDALLKMATDQNLRERLGRNARKRVLEQFSLDECARQYSALYSELANADPSA